MSYREMAMDAGYTGDEADQVAATLEQQDQAEYERWADGQQQLDELAAARAPRPCTSEHHDPPVGATVVGDFRQPWNHANDADGVAYCARCATTLEELGYFTRTGTVDTA